MKWLVFGAGAIGTYIGGSLALQAQRGGTPQRVVFLERPEVAAQVGQRGLRLRLDGEEHTLLSPLVAASLDDALAMGAYDLALFALKSYDTQAALQGLIPYRDQLPPILCLQNGVENEAALAEALGADHVIAGTVTSAVGRRAAGDIVLEKRRGVGIAAGHHLSAPAAAALEEAGLNPRLYLRAADMKWSKLLTNLLANAGAAIFDMTPDEIFQHPKAFHLEAAAQQEALRVMDAQGIKAIDLPGTPVRLLAAGMRHLPQTVLRPLVRRFAGKGRGEKMPSFHIDLYSGGGRSEVDYLNGAVARFGKKHGIPTPANQLLNETLLKMTAGEVKRDAFARQPEKLFSLYEKKK
jgi:2-dehydropantoate 2-reductase